MPASVLACIGSKINRINIIKNRKEQTTDEIIVKGKDEENMNICVVGPFNPYIFKEYFNENIIIPNINVTATSVNGYVLGLLEVGHSVSVVTTYSFEGAPYSIESKNLKVIFVSSKFKVHAFGRLKTGLRLRRFFKNIYTHYDIIHAEWNYEYAFAVSPYAKNVDVYCSVRDWCPYLLSLTKGLKEKYYWYMSYYMFARVMNNPNICFIANSEYLYNQIKNKYPNLHIEIIPNPLHSKYILNEKKYDINIPSFISVCADVSEARKNIPRLLEAFKKYRTENCSEATLTIVGNYSDAFFENLKMNDIFERVVMTGSLSHKEVLERIDKSTCLIHPSLEETFGNILLEGMCRCVPCIGGDKSGAVPAVLGHGKYGVLCDVEDVDSIVAAMRKIEDKSLVKEVVERCKGYIREEYLETVIANKHIELFRGIK